MIGAVWRRFNSPVPASEERPAVRIVTGESFGGGITVHAVPVTAEGGPAPWYMFGGTFIFSSDSRFREAAGHYGALPLHDRQE
ncbi:hypothetical protein [Arthrobacter sp. Soil762]|uniref:hypothetical protein n=1 Tax=Arthrobacter sp. Soil762 TaxID=1736401 RepID=UPI0012E3E43B|nr:hypothetical protein [Arthrobacter sp. Soil762]